MSISPINTSSQTGLVPQSLLGYSTNGVSALEINSKAITIAGLLNTPNPVYVGISAATGLTTTLATGLDVNCSLNMNSNDITNLDTLSSSTGGDLTLSSNNVSIIQLKPTELDIIGEELNLYATSGSAYINTTTGFQVNASDFITLTSSAGGINLQTVSDMNFTSNAGGLVSTMDYIQLIARNQYINLEAPLGGLSFSGISFNLSSADSTISDSGGGLEITSNSSVSLISGTNEAIILNSGDYIEMNPNTYINMTAGQQINLSSGLLFDIILDTANLKFINGIQITDDIDNNRIIGDSEKLEISSKGVLSFQSVEKGIIINGGDGNGGNNDISLTTVNGTGSGGLIGNINLNSAGDLTLTATSIFTNCQGLQLDAGNFIDLLCNNGFVSIISQNDSVNLQGNTIVNIDSPNSNSYGNALPICLNHFENGTWSYTLGGQVFENVFSTNIALPTQFFAENPPSGYTSTRWQINFDMNCWNFTNAGDKGFAIYLSFIDNNANLYEPFLYNNLTPYCKWDNPPSFNGAYSQFKSINFCDYIDFSGLVGSNDSNIRLQMNIAGDNVFNNVDFIFKLGFTRIQRV